MVNLSSNLPWSLANPKWAAALNPILSIPVLQGNQINGISLVANTPQSVNHLLSRQMQGWFIVDQNASASIHRTQPFNSSTITLEATANVTINIWCY